MWCSLIKVYGIGVRSKNSCSVRSDVSCDCVRYAWSPPYILFICFLSSLIKEQVSVVTCDGRSIFGILAGYDQLQNLILKEASERVYSPDADPESVPLGLYVIRGDNVAIISDRDEDLEASTGISSVRAEPLESVVQNVG